MTSIASKTLYLGRHRPLLHSTLDFLWQKWPTSRKRRTRKAKGDTVAAADTPCWDLSGVLIVLPTTRGGRRLAVLLRELAAKHDVTLNRPKIVTTGELPQYLFKPKIPVATELEQTLAWARVLIESPEDKLGALLSNLPAREPLAPWLELASTIRGLYEDLAAGELDFSSVEREVTGDAEQRRWTFLRELHAAYLKCLQSAGRSDPFLARAQAISSKKCSCSEEIVLVGTSDLSRSLTSMLRAIVEGHRDRVKRGNEDSKNKDQSAATRCAVTALVAADDSDRDHFDSFGSIIASRWVQRVLPWNDGHLLRAEDVADQAASAARMVQTWLTDYRPNGITVGVTHDSLVGPVEFEMRARSLETHRELGWTIAQTPVGRLLELLSEHISRSSWRSLAALVRHADVYQFIESQFVDDLFDRQSKSGQWLIAIDNLLANHFPTRCDNELAPTAAKEYGAAITVRDLIQASLRDLGGPNRTLSDWAGRVVTWLQVLFNRVDTSSSPDIHLDESNDSRGTRALRAAVQYMAAVEHLEKSLDVKVSASVAIEMLTARLSDMRVFDPPKANQLTISGWLDLALDDSPAMVVACLNHPYVPEAVTADPFLPGTLRTRLQLNDNERRMARDIHALDVMLSSRKDIKLIVGTRSLDGSPTPPSRLLATSEPLETARRLVQLLDPDLSRAGSHGDGPSTIIADSRDSSKVYTSRWEGGEKRTELPIPPLPPRVVERMSVTAFKDYLTCPYRFFLRHVLHIRRLNDSAGELRPNQFGDLIHYTLERFGLSQLRDESNREVIEDGLVENLTSYAADYFGSFPAAAVRLQIEQARRRMKAIAFVQSERRQQGWSIFRVEAPFGEKQKDMNDDFDKKQSLAGIIVDGQRMPIRGRIDRIDRHDDGRWAIIDYKTHGHPPRKKHVTYNGDVPRWLDLQLPLYQLLIPYVIDAEVAPEQVALSYFNIGDNQNETKINDADFTKLEFESAHALVDDCIRRIRRGEFEPSHDVQFDDYAMILQTGAVANLLDRIGVSNEDIDLLGGGDAE